MRRAIVAALLASALIVPAVTGTASAADKKDKLADYTATGKTENCVDISRIRDTDIIDDQTILFRMNDGKYYVNRLPHRCPTLKIQDSFGYTLRGLTKLCNVDVITVLSSDGSHAGPTCGLGKFEEMTRNPKSK